MEKAYNKAANLVYNGTFTLASQVIADLKELYLDDETFKKHFELKSINTSNSQQKKIARYILHKLEGNLPGGIRSDFVADDGTIEHILPENPDTYWSNLFNEEDHQKNVYMMGNLTLLEASKNNKEASQKPFEVKIQIYRSSRYALSNQIAGTEWSIKMIRHRQAHLAKVATGVWKI
jgi:hypothetical protein